MYFSLHLKVQAAKLSGFRLGEDYVFFANKIEAKELRDEDTGEIDDEDKEKLRNYEPETCGWTSPLTDWDTADQKNMLRENNDLRFLKILKGGWKPKKAKAV
mgnify:CR=1 FL=1